MILKRTLNQSVFLKIWNALRWNPAEDAPECSLLENISVTYISDLLDIFSSWLVAEIHPIRDHVKKKIRVKSNILIGPFILYTDFRSTNLQA